MDEITIYENGRPAGTLTFRREGLYTLLEAELPPSPDLTRLWVFGGGERADLGVLEPRRSGRFFRRRYTRAAFSRLPASMDCAVAALADSDTPPVPCHCEASAHTGCGNPHPPARLAAPAAGAHDLSFRGGKSPTRAKGSASLVSGERIAAAPAGPRNDRTAAALNSQNARVVVFDGARYLALPCALRHSRPGLRLAEINGRTYLLFRL